MRLCLFLGLLLILLAFWKGDGGYLDLREYLDDTERLALKGDMRLPGAPGAPAEYNRYSIGLSVIGVPLMWVGAGLQELSGGAVSRRSVAAFTVPILSALFGVLLFEIARLLKYSPRIAFFAALIATLGSPHVTYSRMYYAESAVEFGLLLSVWAYLKFRERALLRWPLIAGLGVAIAGASHYPHALLVACVWSALAVGFWKTSRGVKSIATFALVPAILALSIVALNYSRFGSLVPRGYQKETASNFSPSYIVANLQYVGRMFLRTPWFVPALWIGGVHFWRSAERPLAFGMLTGVFSQCLFFLTYAALSMFPVRYLHPCSALAALGLPALLVSIENRFPSRGLVYATLILLLANAAQFFGDTIFQPFLSSPSGDRVLAYVWYMAPTPPDWKFEGGTPAGALQLAVFLALLMGGAALLWRAKNSAGRQNLE